MTAIIVAKKWSIIKFWLFLKFGIKFKDKAETVPNLAVLDYDAFVNYKYVYYPIHIAREITCPCQDIPIKFS